jgi:hypothetical protein
MRILSLDFDPVFGDDAVRATFAGDDSVFDHDLAIWDPAGSFEWYTKYEDSFQGLPSLSDSTSVRFKADIARRRAEFADFVNSGRTLVVIARPPLECYVATGEVTYSGTGRNRASSRHVGKYDLLSALPASDAKFLKAGGTRIEVDGDGPLPAFVRKYLPDFRYEATISSPPGAQLAHVGGTARVVASVLRAKNGGHLILLPTVSLARLYDEDDEPDEEDSDYRDNAWEFQDDLVTAIQQLSGSAELSRPAWASSYLTTKQKELAMAVAKQQERVENARAKLAKLKQQHQAAEVRDQLYLGTGRALELEVKAVMEALGGTVTEPEPGRDDWKVGFPEGKAVIEVKGVGKSAAEKHAAQLEKWVATELEQTGSAPKGILVVNTWKDKPLDERTEPDFPSQMLPYSTSRGHCLVTGLQLFVILADIEANPDKKGHWRRKIMGCAGVLDGIDRWESVINKADQTDTV